jgi:DNA-binding transcriptional ArsR family regulator
MKAQPPRAFETPADLDAMVAKAREVSEFLKALAQESRLLILCALAGGEKSVGELEAFLSQRQSTVSQQLARLRLENLVAARRDGATIHYSLASDKVRTMLAAVHQAFCQP